MAERIDETWQRLHEWTYGQAPSERLAAQVLLSEGFTDLDPSHPLGGPDGQKDGIAKKDGKRWVMAVYFPRGKKSFKAIRSKFESDVAGVGMHNADGIVFVTNQELTLSQRKKLAASAGSSSELYHLERVSAILDQPAMRQVRDQFLGDYGGPAATAQHVESAVSRLEGLQTGGDSFCYWMLYHFDMDASVAQNFVVIRKGEFPLYDVRLRIVDMKIGVDVLEEPWGEINAPADYRLLKWQLEPDCYYRVFFHARNGSWHQDLILKRSDTAKCWLAATRVVGRSGETRFEHIDNDFVDEFGQPTWQD